MLRTVRLPPLRRLHAAPLRMPAPPADESPCPDRCLRRDRLAAECERLAAECDRLAAVCDRLAAERDRYVADAETLATVKLMAFLAGSAAALPVIGGLLMSR